MAKFAFFLIIVVALILSVLAIGDDNQDFLRIFNNFQQKSRSPDTGKHNVQTFWIEQKLDHFDSSENRTWQMRYMANDEFFKSGGPLFISLGGQMPIYPTDIQGDLFCDLAEQHNGYLFTTEHRFYGKSLPVDDMSNENMKYLSVRQVLADLAHFIRFIKSTIPGLENSKTILAGCSYTGTLVTWFRKLYPELVTGGWASSAPLLAKMNFYEYYEAAGRSIELMGGTDCYDRIDRGVKELEFMFDNQRGAEAKVMLGLCDTFNENNNQDVLTLFEKILEPLVIIVQYHEIYNITTSCRKIMEGSTDLIGVVNFVTERLKWNKGRCKNISYEKYLKSVTNPVFKRYFTRRQSFYHFCSETGWFQITDSMRHPFGTKNPSHFYATLCVDAFGDIYSAKYRQQRINDINEMFGGVEVDIDNIYWTQGELDPWKEIGKQTGSHTTVIPYHSHCSDLAPIRDENSPAMRASKEKLVELVREWLA